MAFLFPFIFTFLSFHCDAPAQVSLGAGQMLVPPEYIEMILISCLEFI